MASADGQKKKIIKLEDFMNHNTDADCWISVRGKVYDVTKWLPTHPGGKDIIVFNGGRDATQLFEAYHPIRVFPRLEKYYIGDLDRSEHPTFPPMSDFYKGMKAKVEKYFEDRKISPRHAPEMIVRVFILIGLCFALHWVMWTTTSTTAAIFLAVVLGLVHALICFQPVHEGSHGATTNYPIVWKLFGLSHDFLNGASFFCWIHQHFLGHHPFTNVTHADPESKFGDAIDPDVVTHDPDIRRIKPNQSWHSHYRWQAFYVPLLYGLLGIKTRISELQMMFVTKMDGAIRLTPPTPWYLWTFILGKIVFLFWRILLPSYFFGISRGVGMFLIVDLVTSYILAFVFQVNHVVGQAIWPKLNEKNQVDMDWAEMQVRTTLDYGHGSWWTTFLSGGLNYQVTHHLFPGICQLHYPEIAPIIMKHCQEHGIKYNVLPDFWTALKAHIGYLAEMGEVHIH